MPITNSVHNGFPLPGAGYSDSRRNDVLAIKSALVATDQKLYDLEQAAANVTSNGYISASFPGNIGPLNSNSRWSPPRTIEIFNITFNINTPASSADIVLDIKKNGVSLFTGVKPTLPVGVSRIDVALANFVITTTDYITLDILSGNGADMTVRLDYQ